MAPAVRTCDPAGAAAVGLGLVARFRVCAKLVEGVKRIVVSKAMAMGFKLFLLLNCSRFKRFPLEAVIVPKTNAAARMTPKVRGLVA